MILVVAASADLWPSPDIISNVAALIGSLPQGSEVRLRARDRLGHQEQVAPLELAARTICEHMGIRCVNYVPGWGPSRDTVFRRDYEMVRGAHRVVGFFMDADPMGGGAGHVVHAAIQKGVPCEAWMWTDDGLVNLGSDDGNIADIEAWVPFPALPGISLRGATL